MASIAHVEAERLHPADDQVAAGLVLVGERQPGAAAALDGADRGQLVEGVQQMPVIKCNMDSPIGSRA